MTPTKARCVICARKGQTQFGPWWLCQRCEDTADDILGGGWR